MRRISRAEQVVLGELTAKSFAVEAHDEAVVISAENSSASVIKALLSADLLDRLYLMICPEIAGGGQRLFEDGMPSSKWTLTQQETGDLGEIALVYDRAR